MSNFTLPFIPERPQKPRNEGVTMMMDKGLIQESRASKFRKGENRELNRLLAQVNIPLRGLNN